MASEQQQSTDLGAELTLDEAAAILGVHDATARRYIREGKLPAHKVPGPHGEEWRIYAADAEALANGKPTLSGTLTQTDSSADATVGTALAQIESTVRTDLKAVREGLEEGLRRLGEVHQQQAERVDRDLAAQVGRLEAERDQLTQERDELKREIAELREELAAEKRRKWWEKLMKPDG